MSGTLYCQPSSFSSPEETQNATCLRYSSDQCRPDSLLLVRRILHPLVLLHNLLLQLLLLSPQVVHLVSVLPLLLVVVLLVIQGLPGERSGQEQGAGAGGRRRGQKEEEQDTCVSKSWYCERSKDTCDIRLFLSSSRLRFSWCSTSHLGGSSRSTGVVVGVQE